MGLKIYKPTTPSLRGTVLLDNSKLTKKKPEDRLLKNVKYRAARGNGRISVRHKGGRAKRMYRMVDFRRDKLNVEAEAIAIEYDPNRSANIALLKYKDGEKRYILSPKELKVGMSIVAGEDVPVRVGNATLLKNLPSGIRVHNIELQPGKGGQLCRSAGSSAMIMGGDKEYIQLKMQSGEIRLVHGNSYATIGEVGNIDHANVKLGKAGRSRHLGVRPTVRGQAMGAHDHPHGGGEAKHRVGGQRKTIYGHRTDVRTRKNKRSNRFIVQRRKK